MSTLAEQVESFLGAGPVAVAGASRDRAKYGNAVLRAYLRSGFDVVAIHPEVDEVEGVPAYADVLSVPRPIAALSIVTQPEVTEGIVRQAVRAGIRHIWMQPGAESEKAVADAVASGANVLHGGPCVLVALSRRR